MADRPTIPPRGRQASRPSFDNPEAARLAEENERLRVEALLAHQRAEAARQTHEAAQEARRRALPSEPPKSSGDAIKVQASGSPRSWAYLLGFLLTGGLSSAALLTKAEAPRVASQGETIAVTREELNALVTRVEVLEKSDRRQNALQRATMDYTIQVLADGKVAILTRPQGLPPMKPIDTHWPRPLPGRQTVAPILIVDTPYPSIEWVTE